MANTSLNDVAPFENTQFIKFLNSLAENTEKIIALLEIGLSCDFSEKSPEVAYHYHCVIQEIVVRVSKNIDEILLYQGEEHEVE